MTVLVVVAHYDDETIGASQLLYRARERCRVIHITDSAPRDLSYAKRAGFATRREYAAARRREFLAAMRVIGVASRRCHPIDVADQDAARQVERIARVVRGFVTPQTRRVFTHAYEGGHPDHDACALAVSLAVQGLDVELLEMPFYHAADGALLAGEFLSGDAGEPNRLSRAAVARKREMFRRFVSQAHVFDRFGLEQEPYRPMPRYDFSQPPHPGKLYYETRPLNWTWQQWREATAASPLAPHPRSRSKSTQAT